MAREFPQAVVACLSIQLAHDPDDTRCIGNMSGVAFALSGMLMPAGRAIAATINRNPTIAATSQSSGAVPIA